MSPAFNQHGKYQTLIAAGLLTRMVDGEVITECSIDTSDGTKVADVSWGSAPFYEEHGIVTPLPKAPEICVEIVSPSNSQEEMQLKASFYFDRGAKEVWICDDRGSLEFMDKGGFIERSSLSPDFPSSV